MDISDIRFRIAASRRILYREGCDSNVGGHVSARADDHDDAFWVTGFEYFDQSAIRSIQLGDPMPPLPLGYGGGDLGVHFGFEFVAP